MKTLLVATIFFSITIASYGQFNYFINFENSWNEEQIKIELSNNPLNPWMVGKPDKTTFTEAYSKPNAIMTDTLNSVQPNDTSIFYLYHERDNAAPFHIFDLNFWFQMEGDSTDFGTIEISPDNGFNWINVLQQDTTYDIRWRAEKPTLSGSTNGWTEFSITMENWASTWGVFPIPMTADTIIFKFTYITDSNITQYGGWIIDNFHVNDFWESVKESRLDDLISIYPNPANEYLYIKSKSSRNNSHVQILNNLGQVVYSKAFNEKETINVGFLKNGIYYLKFTDFEFYTTKKIIIDHN